MPVTDPIRVMAYDAQWPTLFIEQSETMRAALGEVALRIDHIGSTAVPGLAAKPIIDIQISVAAFDPLEAFRTPLERSGYVFRATTRSRPSVTSASGPPAAGPTSTFAGQAAPARSSRCCSATSCALIRRGRSATPS
jgi:GrpB-like predicted nucleotidyltransferase (UPF0157 family)